MNGERFEKTCRYVDDEKTAGQTPLYITLFDKFKVKIFLKGG
jgi:hypothetical protein